jgi:hypothetical protein
MGISFENGILRTFLKKGLSFRVQRPGLPPDGPLTPALMAMSCKDEKGYPVSPVGADLADLYARRTTRVAFLHTSGSGITPWRRFIILDTDFCGTGQVSSPDRIGLVAHELTHLLQRDLAQRYYWPSGGLRPSLSRRWVGDSTNYMEVIAYLIEWTIEYDLLVVQVPDPGLDRDAQGNYQRDLTAIRRRLATLASTDAQNAARLVVNIFPDNAVYRKNYHLENHLSDRRIPSEGWHIWLRQMGFSRESVDHVFSVAAQGQAVFIDPVSLFS